MASLCLREPHSHFALVFPAPTSMGILQIKNGLRKNDSTRPRLVVPHAEDVIPRKVEAVVVVGELHHRAHRHELPEVELVVPPLDLEQRLRHQVLVACHGEHEVAARVSEDLGNQPRPEAGTGLALRNLAQNSR